MAEPLKWMLQRTRSCVLLSLFAMLWLAPDLCRAQRSEVWSPDLGNGTYKNPVLNADYSDPDVIRYKERFYLVASSFDSVPGLPILESYDLVNWKIISHALTRQPPLDRYRQTQHGDGVWAPAIRFHQGMFYIFYPDPDIGIYMIKALKPNGPWSEPLLIKQAKGWIDPCPLWDDDGRAYLVSALAGSRAGAKSVAILSRMKPDGTELLDDGAIVYDGHAEDPTFEGPKLYKRDGWYYIFAPAGGVSTGWQVVLRSRHIYGPYERRVVLQQGSTTINGPHQGAWVDTGTGEDWFLHFQDAGWLGRVVHLEPMRWAKGWPEMGSLAGGGVGQPVMVYRKPKTLRASPIQNPVDSDEFNEPALGLQWQWQTNPDPGWAFPSQALGALRMIAVTPPTGTKNLWDTPAVLFQKVPAESFVGTVKLSVHFKVDGERAGLVLLGRDYGSIFVKKTREGFAVRQAICDGADKGAAEVVQGSAILSGLSIFLRVTVQDGHASFSYSTDEVVFKSLGAAFQAKPGVWVGAKVGIFSAGPETKGEAGYADFDWIHFNQAGS